MLTRTEPMRQLPWICGLQKQKMVYLHIDEGYTVNSGKTLYCLEASSLNVQNDITDLRACTQTAQTSAGLSARYDTGRCQGCIVC